MDVTAVGLERVYVDVDTRAYLREDAFASLPRLLADIAVQPSRQRLAGTSLAVSSVRYVAYGKDWVTPALGSIDKAIPTRTAFSDLPVGYRIYPRSDGGVGAERGGSWPLVLQGDFPG
jgi:hypothetical protein